jgi:two-component system, OmpR family, response regulator
MASAVLVVDDEMAICEGLAAFLEDEGMQVQTAHSGEEAIELLAADPLVQVCIIDLRLPGMNGTEAMVEIHRRVPAVRFVIHTGTAREAVLTELRRTGLQAPPIFKKPAHDLGEMARVVFELCRGA